MALPKLNDARYVTTIPSLNKQVEFRPYLVKEEKILMIALESQDQKQVVRAIKDVLKSCIYDDINVDKLAMFDLESLFLALRSKSVGETADIKLKCEHCETPNEITIPLDEVKMTDVEVDPKVMLTDKVGVVLRYPSLSDIENVKTEGGVDEMMKLLSGCIETIFDEDDVYDSGSYTKKELNNFIEELNSDQFKKLTGFFEDLPSMVYDAEFKCTNCGKENSVELRGLQSFFT